MQAQIEAPDLFRELVGEKGQSHDAAVKAFAERGILVKPGSIPDYRNGRREKPRPEVRLNLVAFLKAEDATTKIEHYFNLGQARVDLTKPQITHPHRLSSEDLNDGVVKQFNLTHIQLSEQLRAIRLDICASEKMEPDLRVKSMFSSIVTQYFDDYDQPKYAANERVQDIKDAWDGSTVGDFYRILYAETSGSGIATWTAYEAKFIRDYYQMLREEQPALSPFDRFSLEAMISGKGNRYAKDLREWTGILIGRHVIYSHVRVLTATPNSKT